MTGYNLQHDGVAMVTYESALREAVLQASEAWRAFCALPASDKQRFAMTDTHMGVGYEAKDGSGPHGDRKENFDFMPGGYNQLAALLQPSDEVAHRFLAAARALGELVVPMAATFGQQIETRYGVAGFAALAQRSAANAFFRFLQYPPAGTVGDVMAEPHVDHSGFTFHLHETNPGCERLGFDGKWQTLPVAAEQAVAFGGMQLQLVSNGALRGLVHRVVADEASTTVGREAIVCFVALDDVPIYDRKARGRLQELPGIGDGATYRMSPAEFADLFEK